MFTLTLKRSQINRNEYETKAPSVRSEMNLLSRAEALSSVPYINSPCMIKSGETIQ